MRFQVVVTHDAETDLEEIVDFVAEREGPLRASGLAAKLEAELASLATARSRGSIPRELAALGITEFRQVSVGVSRAFYRVIARRVGVLLVADGRRELRALLERRLLHGDLR